MSWKNQIQDRLAGKGFDDVTAYMTSRPNDELMDMAEAIGVVPVDLRTLWYEESNKRGGSRGFAISTFVRQLRTELPEGWGRGAKADYRAAKAYAFWASFFVGAEKEATGRVWQALRDDPPAEGWRPVAGDSLLTRIFTRVWPSAGE